MPSPTADDPLGDCVNAVRLRRMGEAAASEARGLGRGRGLGGGLLARLGCFIGQA
jgi:hypothetical protein